MDIYIESQAVLQLEEEFQFLLAIGSGSMKLWSGFQMTFCNTTFRGQSSSIQVTFENVYDLRKGHVLGY